MIYEIMKKRRSIRKFKQEPLTRDVLAQLINAGITAPSAGNRQLWRFTVVQDRKLIRQASASVEEQRQNIIQQVQPSLRADFENYSGTFTAFKDAPALLVALYKPVTTFADLLKEEADQNIKKNLLEIDRDSAFLSVSLAVQNILLQAVELGIGTCCMTGPLIAQDRLENIFDIPDNWHIAVLIAAGFPDEAPESTSRRPANSIVKWL